MHVTSVRYQSRQVEAPSRRWSTMKVTLPLYLIESILLLSLKSCHGQGDLLDAGETAGTATATATAVGEFGESSGSPLVCALDAWRALRLERRCVTSISTEGSQPEAISERLPPDIGDSDEAGGATDEGARPPDETLVSFEEWKKIQEDQDEAPPSKVSEGDGVPSPHDSANASNGCVRTAESSLVVGEHQIPCNDTDSTAPREPPKHPANRYNYASPDCSARIHSSSPQTQHASSLLNPSRDRYMLTPCKADEHWVVIELCDEIRIDSVEVAMWEFFSGVVREVKLSVGGEDGEDWEQVALFMGKNIRGSQVCLNLFHS